MRSLYNISFWVMFGMAIGAWFNREPEYLLREYKEIPVPLEEIYRPTIKLPFEGSMD